MGSLTSYAIQYTTETDRSVNENERVFEGVKKMGKNRGPDPDEKVLRMLCGKAAGMCQFEGCNQRLFYDGVTTKKFIDSNVAHIIASSPDGVRGDAVKSPLLSGKVENLMLMCYRHHKLIDDLETGERDYPVQRLQEIKRSHEEKLDKLCGYFNVPKTELLCFSSPIKGKEVTVDVNIAGMAVLPDKQPATPYGQNIHISSAFPYGSPEYWRDLEMKLMNATNIIRSILSIAPQSHFSIFPLAPMPLIAKLGEIISDKIQVDVYQKTRVPDTWQWQADVTTNEFFIKKKYITDGSEIALVIGLTSDISDEQRINTVISPNYIYNIFPKAYGVDCIKSKYDLSAFWHVYLSTMDNIVNSHGKNCKVNLFMSLPVSAAFEIGRRYMPAVYPNIIMYDDTETGFQPALIIGGQQ